LLLIPHLFAIDPSFIRFLYKPGLEQSEGEHHSEERDELLLELKIKLAKQLLTKHIHKKKIRVLMNFLKYYVRFENQLINDKFEKEIEILTERSNTMGVEENLDDCATKSKRK